MDPLTMMLLASLGGAGLSYIGGGKHGLTGSKPRFEKHSMLTGHQVKSLNKILSDINPEALDITQSPLYQKGQSFISDLLSPDSETAQAFEAPYKRQFSEEILPQIAERFAGTGSLDSSGFQNTVGRAGAGLSENLAALRSQLAMQAVPQAFSFSQQPFSNLMSRIGLGLGTNKFTGIGTPGQAGFLQNFGQSMAGAVPYMMMGSSGMMGRQGMPSYGQQQFWNG